MLFYKRSQKSQDFAKASACRESQNQKLDPEFE
jgi:hypothetical protein